MMVTSICSGLHISIFFLLYPNMNLYNFFCLSEKNYTKHNKFFARAKFIIYEEVKRFEFFFWKNNDLVYLFQQNIKTKK